MRRAVPRHRVVQTLLLAASAGLLTVAACDMNAPGEPPGAPKVVAADAPMFEFQAEQSATPVSNGSSARYPDALRLAGVEGEVLAQFIVGPDGRVDVPTFKVLKSTNHEFTVAVRNALPQMGFNPAKVGGKAVRQLVQQPFTFSISR